MPVTDVPSYWELLELFEGEPDPEHADGALAGGQVIDWKQDWPYSSVTFTAQRGDTLVTLYIWPSGQRSRISVLEGARQTVRLELEHVEEITVERLHGADEVVFRTTTGLRLQPCRLRLAPEVWVRWGVLGPYEDD